MSIAYSKTYAQAPDTVLVIYPDSLRPKLSYTINWDSRSSIIKEQRVNIRGINTGIILGRNRHEITIGYYWMNFNSYLRLLDLRKKAAKRINLDYYTKTDMYFFSFMYWQNFINNRKWLVSVPIEIGIGTTKNESVSLFNEIKIWKRNEYFIPVQAATINNQMAVMCRNKEQRYEGKASRVPQNINPTSTPADNTMTNSQQSIT